VVNRVFAISLVQQLGRVFKTQERKKENNPNNYNPYIQYQHTNRSLQDKSITLGSLTKKSRDRT